MKKFIKLLNILSEKKVFSTIASAITLFWIGYILYLVVENSSTLGRIFIVVWGVVVVVWWLTSLDHSKKE